MSIYTCSAAHATPLPLMVAGANILTTVAEATNRAGVKTALAMGHIDTGASMSSIDIGLARYLELAEMGYRTIQTAGGPRTMPCFFVDLMFQTTKLRPIRNLLVSSCDLGYDPSGSRDARNMGILIGRDVMAKWHITWDGLTSTVTICD